MSELTPKQEAYIKFEEIKHELHETIAYSASLEEMLPILEKQIKELRELGKS